MSVQFEFAKDENGELVHIDKVHSLITESSEVSNYSKKYICATEGCNSKMIPVFGETGRAYHFRHKNLKFLHQGETPLHYNTKYLLAEYFHKQIEKNNPINYHYVSEEYGLWLGCKNIINEANKVIVERNATSGYRPDISVLKNDNPILFIEIVKSHDINKPVLDYIKTSQVPCLKIYITEALYRVFSEKFKQGQEIEFWSDDKNIELLNIDSWVRERENEKYRLIAEIENIKTELDSKRAKYKSSKEYFLAEKVKLESQAQLEELEKETELLKTDSIKNYEETQKRRDDLIKNIEWYKRLKLTNETILGLIIKEEQLIPKECLHEDDLGQYFKYYVTKKELDKILVKPSMEV